MRAGEEAVERAECQERVRGGMATAATIYDDYNDQMSKLMLNNVANCNE